MDVVISHVEICLNSCTFAYIHLAVTFIQSQIQSEHLTVGQSDSDTNATRPQMSAR